MSKRKKDVIKISILYLLKNAAKFKGLLNKEADYYHVGGRSLDEVRRSELKIVHGRLFDIIENSIMADNFFGYGRDEGCMWVEDNIQINPLVDGTKYNSAFTFTPKGPVVFNVEIEVVEELKMYSLVCRNDNFLGLAPTYSTMSEEDIKKAVDLLFSQD